MTCALGCIRCRQSSRSFTPVRAGPMTDVIVKNVSAPAEPKITAAQIEAQCPDRLQEIGKEIRERFKKAQNGYKKADDHLDAIKALLNEAERLCNDEGG